MIDVLTNNTFFAIWIYGIFLEPPTLQFDVVCFIPFSPTQPWNASPEKYDFLKNWPPLPRIELYLCPEPHACGHLVARFSPGRGARPSRWSTGSAERRLVDLRRSATWWKTVEHGGSPPLEGWGTCIFDRASLEHTDLCRAGALFSIFRDPSFLVRLRSGRSPVAGGRSGQVA